MRKLIHYYNKFEEYMLVGSLIFTVCLIFIQVVMRYIFNSSLSWSEELARFIFIWQIWMGASIGLRDKKHIKVELISGLLKERGLRVLNIGANIIFLVFCIFLVINGTQLVSNLISRKSLSAAMRIPMYLVYISLPISAFVMALRTLGQIYEVIVPESKAEGGGA